MRITFVGHACLLIQTQNLRILTDPYSSEIGYAPVDESADIVTLSHDNPKWHSCLDDVRGDYQILHGLELWEEKPLRLGGLSFEWIRVFENLPDDGPNAMLKITSEKLRVLHMADIGHAVDDATLESCGQVDILLAPTGGNPTIELEDLMDFVRRLNPRIVIPMHYAIPSLAMNLRPVDDLISLWDKDAVRFENGSSVELNAGIKPAKPTLCVLKPKRLPI